MTDYDAFAKKLKQMSLDFGERLSAVLGIDVVPSDPGKLLFGVGDDDGCGIADECVEDDFILVVYY